MRVRARVRFVPASCAHARSDHTLWPCRIERTPCPTFLMHALLFPTYLVFTHICPVSPTCAWLRLALPCYVSFCPVMPCFALLCLVLACQASSGLIRLLMPCIAPSRGLSTLWTGQVHYLGQQRHQQPFSVRLAHACTVILKIGVPCPVPCPVPLMPCSESPVALHMSTTLVGPWHPACTLPCTLPIRSV